MPRKGEVWTARPGERFGRLVVISAEGKARVCRCDCGNDVRVERTSQLTSGTTASCGCLRREVTRARATKHGATAGRKPTRAYTAWTSMIDRCTNPKTKKWDRYGGRGIAICDRWRHSFEAFLADMGEPAAGHSLDRIDNDGPYSPENCRWAPDLQQARNRSNNRVLTHNGRSQTVAEWSDELGIPYRTILARLRYGWPVKRALSKERSDV